MQQVKKQTAAPVHSANFPKPNSKAHKRANRQIDWWQQMYTYKLNAERDINEGADMETRRAGYFCIQCAMAEIPRSQQAQYLLIFYTGLPEATIIRIVCDTALLFS